LNSGTYTNEDGAFDFVIPSNCDSVTLSHVSYIKRNISTNYLKQDPTLYLKPQTTILDDNVIVKSKRGKEKAEDIIKKAITKIDDNLLQEYSVDAFYRQIHYFDNIKENEIEYLRLSESALGINYNENQSKIHVLEVRQSDDYRFGGRIEAKSEHQKFEVEKKSRNIEEFLNIDYQRKREVQFKDFKFDKEIVGLGNLNENFIKRHKFKVDKIIQYGENWVYVIKILPSTKSVDLLRRLKKFIVIPVGKITIRGNDYAILEMEYSYIINPKKAKANFEYAMAQMMVHGQVLFSDKIKYKEDENGLYLAYASRDIYDVQAPGGTNIGIQQTLGGKEMSQKESNGFFRIKREFLVNRIYTDKRNHPIFKQKYNTLTPLVYTYNKDFWQSYNSLKQSDKETEKIKRDLERERPLSEQFEDGKKD